VFDEKTHGSRALKVMLPSMLEDGDLRSRFETEAKVTGGVESDHLVRVSDAGVEEPSGVPFLIMDLLRGEDLASLLKRRKPLPAGEVVTYLRQAGLALDKTHAAGIVHRDLKPDNLFLTSRDDGSPCLKILDFGIAKVVAASVTAPTRALGTPIYMAPEQILGQGSVSGRADIYALGQVAYTLLVGEPYWQEEYKASQFMIFQRIVLGGSEAASTRARRRTGVSLPEAFDLWFRRVSATDPEKRFATAGEAIGALARALDATQAQASRVEIRLEPPAATSPPEPATRRQPALPEVVAAPPPALVQHNAPHAAATIAPTPSETAMRLGQEPPVTTPGDKTQPPATKTIPVAKPVHPPGRVVSLSIATGLLVLVGVIGTATFELRAQRAASGARSAVTVTATTEPAAATELAAATAPAAPVPAAPASAAVPEPTATAFSQHDVAPASSSSGVPASSAKPVPGVSRIGLKPEDLVPTANGMVLKSPPAQGPPDEDALRKQLEPVVWSGKASREQIQTLKAICSHKSDMPCRERAAALLKQAH
jgi:serine/threonine protein kinase